MKRAFREWMGILLVLTLAVPASAGIDTWTPGGGPSGGTVLCLVMDPFSSSTLYAGTNDGGVFKTSDGGANWALASKGLGSAYVVGLAADPLHSGTLYAATASGVRKTTDGAANWAAANVGLEGQTVQALAVTVNGTAFAGTTGGLFKSTDGGATWVGPSLSGLSVISLAVAPSLPSTIFAGTDNGNGLYKTTDGGQTWLSSGLTYRSIASIAVNPADSNQVHVGTWDNGTWRSTDGGVTWGNNKLLGQTVRALAIDPLFPDTMYAGEWFGTGVFKSTDGATTWAPTGLAQPYVYALALDPVHTSTLYAGTTRQGLHKTSDGAATWAEANRGLSAQAAVSLSVCPSSPPTIYAGTQGGGVFKSASSGATWTEINTGLTTKWVDAVAADPIDPATAYAGTNDGAFKTTSGGASWSPMADLAGLHIQALAVAPSDHLEAFAVGPNIYRTMTGGSSWTAVYSDASAGTFYTVAVHPSNALIAYVGTTDVGVLKTTDAGASWAPVNTGLTNLWINALAIDPGAPSTLYAATNDGLFKTTDAGAHWNSANSGLSWPMRSIAIDPVNTAIVYACSGNVYQSTDHGATWYARSAGLPGIGAAVALALDPADSHLVYAGLQGLSVWSRYYSPLSCTGSADKSSGVVPLTVQFTGGASGGGVSNAYDWDFGDGSAHSTAQSPSHTYTAGGSITWTLTVTSGGTTCVKSGTLQVTGGVPNRVPFNTKPVKIATADHGANAVVSWDATNCPSSNYHILYGNGDGLSTWTLLGGVCGLGTGGSFNWSAVPGAPTTGKRFLWFLVVGDDGANVEGSWGKTSAGAEEGSGPSNQCGFTARDTSGTCGAL